MSTNHDFKDEIPGLFFRFDHPPRLTPVGNGNINDTYRIDFDQNGRRQTFLLQRLNHLVFQAPERVAANIRRVADHLAGRPDYPYRIPAPVPGLDGRDLQRDDAGNYWRVFPFFDHTFVPETAATPAVAFEAARAYGIFLRALGDLPADALAETIPGFHDTARRWAVFEKNLADDPAGRAAAVLPEIEKIRAAKPVFDAVERLKTGSDLPLRITHNDTKAGNVLLSVETHQAVAVIDWDTVMPGTALSDFGDMVRTFAPDCHEDGPGPVALRTDVLQALCKGFAAATAGFLAKTELENLPLGARWIIGEQALRFLTDYLAGDVYYKTRFPEHNLLRARNQLNLLEKVSAAEGLMREFLTA